MTVNAGARVGTNGGTLAGQVGTYDQGRRAHRRLYTAGIELQLRALEVVVERVGREVIPRVRAQTLSAS